MTTSSSLRLSWMLKPVIILSAPVLIVTYAVPAQWR